MATQLFIDTNIFLNFYHQSGDEPQVIDELVTLIDAGEIVLHFPQQVEDEFVRNRETKLRGTHKEFDAGSFQDRVPRHMAGLLLAKGYEDAVRVAKKARKDLLIEASTKTENRSFDVDAKLDVLFQNATRWGHDDVIYAKARVRKERGNPPGKTNSYGDQYNWEMLLSKVPEEDLCVVSRDNDYASVVGKK